MIKLPAWFCSGFPGGPRGKEPTCQCRRHKRLGFKLCAVKVKSLSTMQETQVRSLGQEDPLEKEMATHSRILAEEIPWTEEPGGLQSMGSQESGTT